MEVIEEKWDAQLSQHKQQTTLKNCMIACLLLYKGLSTKIGFRIQDMNFFDEALAKRIKFYPVSTYVNNPNHNDENCIFEVLY